MNHVIIVQLLFSGGAGLIAFSLYYLYSLFNPSERLSHFLSLQLSIVFIVCLNVFHTYTLATIAANRSFQIISYCCSLLWSPCYILFTGLFYTGMGGTKLSAGVKRSLFAFGLAVGSLTFIPFALERSADSILAYQRIIHRCAIIPLCGLTQVAFSAIFFLRSRKGDNPAHKGIARWVLSLNILAAIACTLAVNISIVTGNAKREIDLVVMDIYFFAWNLSCIAVFFGFNRVFIEKMKEAGKRRRAGAEKPFDASSPGDWSTIQKALLGKRLFVEPSLDLSYLSRETRLPRNRLSSVINRYSGSSFNDYVNSLRIGEFKRIMRDGGYAGNILAAAFDSGFNSKATFYHSFRKAEGESPGDYLKRMEESKGRIAFSAPATHS